VHRADRAPYTPGDVAAAINAEAGEDVISGQYIWLLRTGRRDNLTYKHLIAISWFFGVSPIARRLPRAVTGEPGGGR
jgi:hypothetical protein